jgi:putative N6-adenine-specific DNA methylase
LNRDHRGDELTEIAAVGEGLPPLAPPAAARYTDRVADRIFAACAPGLEPVLARELEALGLGARAVAGGAEAEGEDALELACVGSRVADAVALRLYAGPEGGLDAAFAQARRRFGAAAPVALRRERGQATLSLDAVGSPLYRRGWRARVGAAPLRESSPFLDPMCGSGTLAIEAAEIAARRAPGRLRRFAFEGWPGRDPRRLEAVRARFAAAERRPPAPIHASDRNAGVLRLALKNAAAAGLADAVRFERRDAAAAAPPPGSGLLCVNPPYGLRLAEDAATAWRSLRALLDRLPGWAAFILSADRELEALLGRAAAGSLEVRNARLRCRLLRIACGPPP